MDDQYLPNNFGPSKRILCLTYCKNNKIKRKRRSRRKTSELDQRSTLVERGFDSVFSLSPVITEISKSFFNIGSGDTSPEEQAIGNQNHTYVNMLNNESTRFEDFTQIEKNIPTILSITNV